MHTPSLSQTDIHHGRSSVPSSRPSGRHELSAYHAGLPIWRTGSADLRAYDHPAIDGRTVRANERASAHGIAYERPSWSKRANRRAIISHGRTRFAYKQPVYRTEQAHTLDKQEGNRHGIVETASRCHDVVTMRAAYRSTGQAKRTIERTHTRAALANVFPELTV